MVINAIRFRAVGEPSWQSWKLNLGAGPYLNYQCLTGKRDTLTQLARAVDFALTGKDPSTPTEVMLQLSDDAGRSWIVQRRPGLVRYLRDGETLPSGAGERALAAALMDIDEESAASGDLHISLKMHTLYNEGGRIGVRAFGSESSQTQDFGKAISGKIRDIAAATAKALSLPQIQNPKVLVRLAQRLEPVYAQYREVDRLSKEAQTPEAPPISNEDLATQQRLGQELELIEEIRIHATPLLAPGVPSLKALKDALATSEEEIAKTCEQLSLSAPERHAPAQDYSKAIEALSRLEAHGKLLRASQSARKHCEQKVEAPFKKYLEILEKEFVRDRQMIQHLEACLGQIDARLGAYNRDLPGFGDQTHQQGAGVRTWFDRFKAKSQEEEKQDPVMTESPSELEIARQVVAYALAKINDMAGGWSTVQIQHDSALQALDSAHEELVCGLGRLRDHWLTQAREAQLPEDLTLGKLLKIVASQGQLAGLVDRREDLKERVHKHATRLSRIERLVVDWRRMTGSQKQSDLENTGILLQEARDIIRYHDTKRKRFDQLTSSAAASQASLTVKSLFHERKVKLLSYWQKVFTEEAIPILDLGFGELPQLFKASGYIRALALVHGESQVVTSERIFDPRTEGAAISIYICEESPMDHKARLALLSELEAAHGGELRLLLVADEAMAQALAPLGIGVATILPKVAATEGATPAKVPGAPRPTPTIKMPGQTPAQMGGFQDPNGVLAERAQRALNILSGKVR